MAVCTRREILEKIKGVLADSGGVQGLEEVWDYEFPKGGKVSIIELLGIFSRSRDVLLYELLEVMTSKDTYTKEELSDILFKYLLDYKNNEESKTKN